MKIGGLAGFTVQTQPHHPSPAVLPAQACATFDAGQVGMDSRIVGLVERHAQRVEEAGGPLLFSAGLGSVLGVASDANHKAAQ